MLARLFWRNRFSEISENPVCARDIRFPRRPRVLSEESVSLAEFRKLSFLQAQTGDIMVQIPGSPVRLSPSFLRRRANCSNTHGANHPLVLHLEQLENRCLMNGDPAPADVLTSPSNSEEIAVVPAVNSLNVASLSLDDYYPVRPYVAYYESPPEGPAFDRIDELPEWLVAEADRRYSDQFGQPAHEYWSGFGFVSHELFITSDFSRNVALDSVQSFSATNVQVAGVDEADLVETDGEFLYMIVQNELLIIDVRDAESPSIASRVLLDSNPTGIYLNGDRLTIVSNKLPSWSGGAVRPGIAIPFDLSLDSYSWNFQPAVQVQVLDVSEAAIPELVEHTELDGRLVSSRMVDGQLRLVVQQNFSSWQLLPALKIYSVGFDQANQQHEFRYETRNEYLGRVFQQLQKFSLPGYRTFNIDGAVTEQQHLLELDDIADHAGSHVSATTIATFDTLDNDAGPDATESVLTRAAAEIYATEDSMYVFGSPVQSQPSGTFSWINYATETAIWKFNFASGGDSIKLAAQGKVDGQITSQFAADEHDGYLRLVTTGRTWSSGQDLFVLNQVGEELQIVGQINNIAPNENLHSVRFLGDEAFVVTFRKVDPLFAIDLSDPANPRITGELKIPGFSDYLQPLDENHLLGVGRGADERIGRFQEVQISIFDVSDMSDPQLAHRYSFGGGRSTQSEALYEHHAVSYFSDAGLLAIPIFSAYQWGSFRFGVDNSAILETNESALQVFRVDTATGFEPVATIKHNSRIRRSLTIGEHLIVVSQDYVTVHDLNDPRRQIAKLDLQVGSDVGVVELEAYLDPSSLTGLDSPADEFDSNDSDSRAESRQPYTPSPRRTYSPLRGNYAPRSAARYEVLDRATEQIELGLAEQLADELALDLASDLASAVRD